MKKLLCILLCVMLILPFFSCSAQQPVSESFYLMDTLITVTLYTDTERAEPVFKRCRAIISELDTLWSRTREESDTARFNASLAGVDDLDPRTVRLIRQALEVSQKTDGAFDITVLPLVTLWETCEAENALPSAEALSQALSCVGFANVAVGGATEAVKSEGISIDFGGIGKGAAISCLIDYLESTDIPGGVVSFGSNVAVFGQKPKGEPYRIALRDPFEEGAYAGALTLKRGEVLSVSGDYERYYTVMNERYHHILDPTTGYPARSGLSSVAVVCSDGALADALSTALFVMGEEKARAFYQSGVYDFEAIFITSTGTVSTTAGLTDVFEKE